MNIPGQSEHSRHLKDAAVSIFTAGIRAVAPEACIRRHVTLAGSMLRTGEIRLDLEEIPRIYLVGFGKASAAMAAEAETLLGDRIHDGLIITKYGHGVPLRHCRVMEAGHPVPDAAGTDAVSALLDLLSQAGPQDLVLCMISGGASALTPAPAPGISLADKQETTRQLLGCGATIHEVNTIRKHLSRIKGGQLCRKAGGARIISLILSDVIGDDLDIIGSGITAPDRSSFGDCKEILDRYGIREKIPGAALERIMDGIAGRVPETPHPGDKVFSRVDNIVIGSLSDALAAAKKEAERQRFTPIILSSRIQGEACDVAKVLCAIAGEAARSGTPVAPPACLLSGGETTVTLKGSGKGGRNMELALAGAIELAGGPEILMLSAGTDGTDGPTDAAGAFAGTATVSRAAAQGISARDFLADNDSYHFFHRLGDLMVTGPTRTNVMDLQILLVR